MRVKQLRTFLYARGVSCTGCAEKSDLVAKAMESRELQTTDEKEEAEKKIFESLRKSGLGGMPGMKMWGKDDIAKFAEMYKNDPTYKDKYKDKKDAPAEKPASTTSETKEHETHGEEIEL